MTKSRLQTEQKILNALEKILLERGFPAVGINSIARQAGCDKVLIYRYFDGLDGLLLAYAETTPLWWEVDEIIVETTEMIGQQPLHLYLQELLKRHVLALQSRPISLEIMAWEMSSQNNLTVALARIRAQRGMALVKQIRAHYQQPTIDIGGILGVFGAAINHLLIRTRKASPQHMTEEWWRLQHTIEQLMEVYG
jgi:AcrR family transcriptional regulator